MKKNLFWTFFLKSYQYILIHGISPNSKNYVVKTIYIYIFVFIVSDTMYVFIPPKIDWLVILIKKKNPLMTFILAIVQKKLYQPIGFVEKRVLHVILYVEIWLLPHHKQSISVWIVVHNDVRSINDLRTDSTLNRLGVLGILYKWNMSDAITPYHQIWTQTLLFRRVQRFSGTSDIP